MNNWTKKVIVHKHKYFLKRRKNSRRQLKRELKQLLKLVKGKYNE